jgi:membrane-bound metal-dependent hydrolase YbcI (DUF457 family)
MRRLTSRAARALERPTPRGLLLAVAALGLSDWASRLAGDSVIPGGPLDETAHFTTMVLVLWAWGPGVTRRLMLGALAASVAIDIDHVPDRLGASFLTAGTPRPYTHSLLTVVVVLMAGALWPRRRELWLGAAAGLLVHFWRDLSEGAGVALVWPFSRAAPTLPHWTYALAMGVIVALVAGRLVAERASAGHASRQPARP